jgi:hypothetical protein
MVRAIKHCESGLGLLGDGGSNDANGVAREVKPEDLRKELDSLKRMVSSLESWHLQQAARKRIEWIEEELKRIEQLNK